MKKKLSLNVFLYHHLIVPIKKVFRKMPSLLINVSEESRRDNVHFSNQTLHNKAGAIAPMFYKVFKPFTAAWFT